MSSATQVGGAVRECAEAAHAAAGSIAAASPATVDAALLAIADRLSDPAAATAVLDANAADVRAGGLPQAMVDRLRLDPDRLAGMAHQLRVLAGVPHPQWSRVVRELPGALVEERRKPVGVIGANFEARPNVVVDVASQLLKSRNAGVLRTGSAAIGSAAALLDEVIAPALRTAGLDPAAIQLVRVPGRDTARALVAQPDLVPLVILRGSGDSTRELTAEAARHGVRTLAHADGGGVLYLDSAAATDKALTLVEESLDRLGVCNRLNLLLVARDRWDELVPQLRGVLDRLGIRADLPPHDHPLGLEWALQDGREATVTIAPADGPASAARTADEQTSGLAACIVTEDPAAAAEFLGTYAGTGAFWNVSTRLLDGFKLLGVPETGINVDRVPGPRGPVTFLDLHLRQFVVTPR
jgi:glutamate-5-semialdehyde dehydrogenase